MLPPLPPSPPLGPPFGTNFSLRNAMQPCPLFPALIVILASSMNITIAGSAIWDAGRVGMRTAVELRPSLQSNESGRGAQEAGLLCGFDTAGCAGNHLSVSLKLLTMAAGFTARKNGMCKRLASRFDPVLSRILFWAGGDAVSKFDCTLVAGWDCGPGRGWWWARCCWAL